MNTKIFYTSLKTPTEKIRFLVKVAHSYFQKNQRLIIFTNDAKTAEFVDQILWSEPKDGFLPHFISQTLLEECIVITYEKSNLNQAKVALNLTNEPIDNTNMNLQSIIEIEDTSTKEKYITFKNKLNHYQKRNLSIVSI